METSPKDVLYRQISEITEPRILKELASGSKNGIVAELLQKCIPEIAKLGGDTYENFGVFAESLSHYLLTNALIPSQRKINVKNIEVDIVIPDSQTLVTTPVNALVFYFAKTANEEAILDTIGKLRDIQPHNENIIVVSKTQIKIPHRTYDISSVSSFSGLLDDIGYFLSSKPTSKFKIFKT